MTPARRPMSLAAALTIWRAKRLSSTTLRILSGPGFSVDCRSLQHDRDGNFSKIDAQHLALAAFASPSSTISIRVTLGGRVPLMSGASGRIFAAFGGIPENQVRRNFERVKWVLPIDYETWRVQVAQAVKNGYAEDCEGFVEGVSTLAVPVYSFDGTMTHTLGVFAVDSQLENRCARRFSTRCGLSPTMSIQNWC